MRGLVAFSALALIGIGLVGCGRFGFERRDAWRLQAEEACVSAKLVAPSAYMSRVSEIDGPGACGITYPFRATALAGGAIGLTNRLTLACPIIPEIDAWLEGTVQPAAELYLGTGVTDVRAGSYSCRPRNNQAGAKVSEHAFGNAIDIMAFRLADGRELTVEKGWRGASEEQDFLREVFVGACQRFTTVLGPGSDVFHYNHFHLDLARHNPRGDRRICKPVLKFEPRLDPERPVEARRPARSPVAVQRPAETAPPLEIDEEGDDPFAAAGPATSRAPPRSNVASRVPAQAPAPMLRESRAPQRPAPPMAEAPMVLPSSRATAGSGLSLGSGIY